MTVPATDNIPIGSQEMSDRERRQLLALVMAAFRQQKIFNKIDFRKWNRAQRELIEATAHYTEILASWGNRMGKTWIAGEIIYRHCRGEYPADWNGRRYDRPVRVMLMGMSRPQIRESSQRVLLNELGEGLGSGVIPKHVVDQCDIKYHKDDNECIDYIKIPHLPSGGWSKIISVTQNMDWQTLMGTEFEIVWPDEQINNTRYYSQAIRATSSIPDKLILLTATPELGRTRIFDRFEKEGRSNCFIYYADLHKSHYSPEQIERMIEECPEDERTYRIYGRYKMGSGLVYNVDLELAKCKPFDIPSHWKRIAGIDFGRKNSKTAIVWIAQDPASGIYYVYDAFWMRGANPDQIYPSINTRDRAVGYRIPVSFPADGNNEEASTGNRIAKVYAELGVRMLGQSAHMIGQDGKITRSVEAGCIEIESMMNAGMIKIFDLPQTEEIFDELSSYHRDEDGKIKKTPNNDPHHLDAMRYGYVMFDRYAVAGSKPGARKIPMVIGMQKGIFHGN